MMRLQLDGTIICNQNSLFREYIIYMCLQLDGTQIMHVSPIRWYRAIMICMMRLQLDDGTIICNENSLEYVSPIRWYTNHARVSNLMVPCHHHDV